MIDPELPQRPMVHPDPAAEPTVNIVAFAQPGQQPGTDNPFARRVKPQSQQQPWCDRRVTRNAFARLDPILQFAQIQAQHVSPDQPRRVVGPDHAVKAHRAKLDRLPLRLPKPRCPNAGLALCSSLRRKLPKQTRFSHSDPQQSESLSLSNQSRPLHSIEKAVTISKKSHALRSTCRAGHEARRLILTPT